MERLHTWDVWYEFARETLRFEPAEASDYAHARTAAELRRWSISARVDALDAELGAS